MTNLRHGRPVHVRYETRFYISWPEHLGAGSTTLDMYGSMVLIPSFGT